MKTHEKSKMPIAVPYIRFSSDEQRHGSSLQRQEDRVSEWLARNPEFTRYNQTFQDLGLSGYHGYHVTDGAMGRLLVAIEKGYIPSGSVVLVEAMDRFSRLEPLQTLRHLETVVKAGIDLVTLTDGQRYNALSLKNQSLMMLAMHAFVAHEYSAKLADFIVSSYDDRAKEAKSGNAIKRRNPFWLTSEGELIAVPATAVEQVFKAFANGTPLRALAIQYADYFANRQSLKHALRNVAAIGHWQRTTTTETDGKRRRVPGELIKYVFKPVVTEELFFQVQKLLDDLAEQAPTVARKFPLAGLLQCGDCGANMVLLRQSNKDSTDTVRCYKRMQNSSNCTNQKTIPVPVVGWFYWETRKPHVLRAYQRTKLPETERQRIKLEGQIALIEKQQTALWKLVAMDPDNVNANASYELLVLDKNLLKEQLTALPVIGSVQSIGMIEFYRFMQSDAFAISNLLQLAGYRIICHQDGTLEVNSSADDNPAGKVQYIGYSRKHKRWWVAYPGGDEMLVG